MATVELSREQELEQEQESLQEYAVDAGWADILVRALVDIAEGRKHPQELAVRASQKAGLWPPSQLNFWDGSEAS